MPESKPEDLDQSFALDEFIQKLTQNLAKAQDKLDEYYQDPANKSTVQYTIPSIAVEVTMDMEWTTKKGLEIIKKTSETKGLSSKVNFNMVAIPKNK